jgi:hypothetical protein
VLPQGAAVTLVTGDRVTLSPTGEVSVEVGPGRAGMVVETVTAAGHVRVIPGAPAAL